MKHKVIEQLKVQIREQKVPLLIATFLLAPVMIVFLCNIYMLSVYNGEISQYPLDPYDVGVVYGGGMKDETTQTDNQVKRVAVGTFLYKKGIISSLRLTGDDGKYRSNELDYMENQSVSMGVPIYAIERDNTGYRTILSCENLVKDYADTNKKILVISNGYHLPRISYLCNHVGISVDTVPIEDVIGEERRRSSREILARVKAVIDVIRYTIQKEL